MTELQIALAVAAALLIGIILTVIAPTLLHRFFMFRMNDAAAEDMGLPWPRVPQDRPVPTAAMLHTHRFTLIYGYVDGGRQYDILRCNCHALTEILHRAQCVH